MVDKVGGCPPKKVDKVDELKKFIHQKKLA
mgnify:CR=1 FL=1